MPGVPLSAAGSARVRGPLDFFADRLLESFPGKLSNEDVFEAVGRGAFEELVTDRTTGLALNTYRIAVLEELQEHLGEGRLITPCGFACYYVELDVRNLGGVNARLGHQKSNELVLRPYAEMLRATVERLTEIAFVFRHGGDEFSAILGPVSEEALIESFECLVAESLAHAAAHGLASLENPKHPGILAHRGTGLRFGFARILPGLSAGEICSQADLRVEESKRRTSSEEAPASMK